MDSTARPHEHYELFKRDFYTWHSIMEKIVWQVLWKYTFGN